MHFKVLIGLAIFPLIAQEANIHYAHLSKAWYPDNKQLLQQKITELERRAGTLYAAPVESTSIRAIIVPHAGYDFSGSVAAACYRLLDKNNIKRVIILAPAHSAGFEGVALPAFGTYRTVLGDVRVDAIAVSKLKKSRYCRVLQSAFASEHSLEIQLPLVQTFLSPEVTLVPLLVGKLDCEQARSIAHDISSLIDAHTLVIVSSDFTHYGQRFNFEPFKDKKNSAARIRELDSQAVRFIEGKKCIPFSGTNVCGIYPLQILMALFESKTWPACEPRLIAYDTSGGQEQNYENSVSYVGMLFTTQKLKNLPIEQQLTQQEQRGLLKTAQETLQNLFDRTTHEELLYPLTSFGVKQAQGAFTTLKKNGTLRGCIGQIITSVPLYKTIVTVTRDAALHDSRFTPLTPEELSDTTLELSVLSSAQNIKSYSDITVGKDGIILEYKDATMQKSALFLPEVPLEFGWNRDTLLQELSKKAGLSDDAWKSPKTHFKTFTTLTIA